MSKVLVGKGVSTETAQGVPSIAHAPFRWTGQASQVVADLGTLLTRETSKVNDALTLSLQELISSEIQELFGGTPKSFNRSGLKKLTNSIAATGSGGIERTAEALSEISTYEKFVSNITTQQAVDRLRNSAADFRKAKTFLAHQAKFVNAFLRFWNDHADSLSKKEKVSLDKDISTREEFYLWSEELLRSWERLGGVGSTRNNKMYQAYWNKFIQAIDSERDDNYSIELIKTIEREYLDKEHSEIFIKHLSNVSTVNRNSIAFKAPAQSSMKVEGGVISISTSLNMSADSLNILKENLAFLCAQETVLQSRKLEISEEIRGGVATLIVSFTAPKELTVFRRTVDLVNKLIKEAQKELV